MKKTTAVFVLLGAITLLYIGLVSAQPPNDYYIEMEKGFLGKILDWLAMGLKAVVSRYLNIMEDSLLARPDFYPLEVGGIQTTNGKIISSFLTLLIPLYMVGIAGAGFYMVFMSESPTGRAGAKMMIEKFLVSMVVVSAAPALYQLLIELSDVMTRSIVGIIKTQIAEGLKIGDVFNATMPEIPAESQVILLFFIMWSLVFSLAIIWFRYLMILLMGYVFPFTLFLYLFDWTKDIGAKLIKFTLVWLFASAMAAIFLAIGIITMETISEQRNIYGVMPAFINPLFFMATCLMVGIAPMVLSGLMKWLGGIVSMVGMIIPGWWGIALAAIGGIMQGKTAGAIAGVGLRAGFNKIFKGARTVMGKGATRAMGGAGRMAGGAFRAMGGAGRAAGRKMAGTGVGKRIGAKLGAAGAAARGYGSRAAGAMGRGASAVGGVARAGASRAGALGRRIGDSKVGAAAKKGANLAGRAYGAGKRAQAFTRATSGKALAAVGRGRGKGSAGAGKGGAMRATGGAGKAGEQADAGDKAKGEGGEKDTESEKMKKDTYLKQSLASGGGRGQEKGQRTEDMLDGMETE